MSGALSWAVVRLIPSGTRPTLSGRSAACRIKTARHASTATATAERRITIINLLGFKIFFGPVELAGHFFNCEPTFNHFIEYLTRIISTLMVTEEVREFRFGLTSGKSPDLWPNPPDASKTGPMNNWLWLARHWPAPYDLR